jgi:type II secretion system protein I
MIERRESGFTLIEVLVALAIVAIACVAALGVFTGGLSSLGHDHNVQYALLIAQSELARVGQDIALQDREIYGRWMDSRGMDGQGDDGFSWRIAITPYGGGAGALFGHRVVVTVGWSEGWQKREVRLETVRLGLQGSGS